MKRIAQPTPEQLRRRARSRRWWNRRRAERDARANATATRCQHSCGGGKCDGLLEDRHDSILGRITRWCPRCDRRLRGVCRDCPRPVEGRIGSALRCAEHKAAARRAQIRLSERRHHDERRAADRRRYKQLDPEVRALKLAYKRAWRKLNPDKVRAQKRRFSLRQSRKHLDWHRRYNARRRAAKAEAMRERYRAENPIPQPRCKKCGRVIPWLGRTEGAGRPPLRCVFCMDKHQLRAAIRRWVARTDFELAAPRPAPAKPARPWKPKQPTRMTGAGERLCLTPKCTAVMTGRRKKCDPCLARDAVVAARLLEGRRGRGRRTDLARSAA